MSRSYLDFKKKSLTTGPVVSISNIPGREGGVVSTSANEVNKRDKIGLGSEIRSRIKIQVVTLKTGERVIIDPAVTASRVYH